MNSERDHAPLSIACARALTDKLYDKRKASALEIEKMVKDFASRNDVGQIKKILRVLGQDFALSQNPNARKGGLIGLAAVAIALGENTAQHIPELIRPILACFSDSDVKVRYCACESLYNVVKVARGAALDYFTDIFNAQSVLATDPDQLVKNGSETLDRLMKDIVTGSSTFDLIGFMPILREKISTKNDFARQFIISWISALNTVPQIEMVLFLPEFLDGLFKILEDSKAEIKTVCGTLLSDFLISIKQNPRRVDFKGMINILALHAQSQDDLLQLTAITWIHEFVELSKNEMLPYASGILSAVLPCLSYEADSKSSIKEKAKIVNSSLLKLFTNVSGNSDLTVIIDLKSVTEVLIKFLSQTKVPTKVAVLKWLYHLHAMMPNLMFDHIEKLFPVLLKVLSDSSDEVVQRDIQVFSAVVSYVPQSKYESAEENFTNPLAEYQINQYFFYNFINKLLQLFNTDRKLLEERGSFIIRQLCIILNSEVIYKAFSEELSKETNMKFISLMVDYLNTILLTSSELFELRNKLKNLSTKESCVLFESLYRCWCHNPVATVALCLLSQNYIHACDLIRKFGSLEVTVEFLTEIDKLVQLIESPIFSYLRLELLEVPHNQHLVQALYGLLMLLPQTDAFHTLRLRLDCIPSLHLQHTRSQKEGKCVSSVNNKFDYPALLKHFNTIQEKHKKEKELTRLSSLLGKAVKNV